MNREKIEVAYCTMERPVRDMGLQRVVRGKKSKTTMPDERVARPADLVNRDSTASRPNRLRVADLTYAPTWRGFGYAAFAIGLFFPHERGLAGLGLSLRSGMAFDALEQADGLVHFSDCGSRCLSVRYTERLAETGI